MSLSIRDQLQAQRMIEAIPAEDRRGMRAEAEATLERMKALMGLGDLSKEEKQTCENAVEILMRLEATGQGKGWWFRTKLRTQLIVMHLGS